MENINGIIVIDKERDYTSHDVVARVRKILSTRKIGHTGTLDPMATGVLPVCIGKGTKVSDLLTNGDKEYVATVKLGIVTDTQDITGNVLSEKEVADFTSEKLSDAIKHFTGEISQIPPMYSAIKINGKKMCDLAREGIEVERKPRVVNIYSIDVLSFCEDGFKAKVKCSKGTYIRTLFHDMGQYLGYGACITTLQRTASSVFGIQDAVTLSELEKIVLENNLSSVLKPIDAVFDKYEKISVDDEIKTRLKNGAPSTVPHSLGTYKVYDRNGEFIAVGKVDFINGRNKISVVKYFGEN